MKTFMHLLLLLLLQPVLAQVPGASGRSVTVNSVLENPPARTGGNNPDRAGPWYQFLRDFGVEFKAFENDGQETSLGVGYSYDRNFGDGSDFTRLWGYDASLRLNGNVAFDDQTNPKDFLTTNVTLGLAGALASDTQLSSDVNDRLDQIEEALTKPMAEAERRALLRESNTLERQSGMHSGWLWGKVGLNAGFESNQRFTSRNYTAGIRAAVDIKDMHADGNLSRFNILDYPFAALRVVSGYDDEWLPRGSALPTAILTVDHVSPDGSDPRAKAGDTSDYWRLGFEAAMKTPIFRLNDTRFLANISYRYFQEFNASVAVRAADLDRIDYLAIGIEQEGTGLFVTYSTGQLPFDAKSDESFELGIKYHF